MRAITIFSFVVFLQLGWSSAQGTWGSDCSSNRAGCDASKGFGCHNIRGRYVCRCLDDTTMALESRNITCLHVQGVDGFLGWNENCGNNPSGCNPNKGMVCQQMRASRSKVCRCASGSQSEYDIARDTCRVPDNVADGTLNWGSDCSANPNACDASKGFACHQVGRRSRCRCTDESTMALESKNRTCLHVQGVDGFLGWNENCANNPSGCNPNKGMVCQQMRVSRSQVCRCASGSQSEYDHERDTCNVTDSTLLGYDEDCSASPTSCDSSQHISCQTVPEGGSRCRCNPGYIVSQDGSSCEQIEDDLGVQPVRPPQ